MTPQTALEPVHGRESIRAMFEEAFAHASMVCIPENVFVDGDWGILEWRDPQGMRGCGFFQVDMSGGPDQGLIRFQPPSARGNSFDSWSPGAG